MERAIKERDQHCIWPGCTQSRHLHIHHIKHWADGGVTSVSNGVCLCSHHHTLVHEGGYAVQRVDHPCENKRDNQKLKEQFVQQQRSNDSSRLNFASSEIERLLCNSEESFNEVRKLSPTRYRFRIVDAQGIDILSQSKGILGESNADFINAKNWDARNWDARNGDAKNGDAKNRDAEKENAKNRDTANRLTILPRHSQQIGGSIRVECREPIQNSYYNNSNNYSNITNTHAQLLRSEVPRMLHRECSFG